MKHALPYTAEIKGQEKSKKDENRMNVHCHYIEILDDGKDPKTYDYDIKTIWALMIEM